MAVNISDYLNIKDGRSAQFNVSVPFEYRQEVAEALDRLMRANPTLSKSGVVCKAIVQAAKELCIPQTNQKP